MVAYVLTIDRCNENGKFDFIIVPVYTDHIYNIFTFQNRIYVQKYIYCNIYFEYTCELHVDHEILS